MLIERRDVADDDGQFVVKKVGMVSHDDEGAALRLDSLNAASPPFWVHATSTEAVALRGEWLGVVREGPAQQAVSWRRGAFR